MTHMMMHGLGDCPAQCYADAAARAAQLAQDNLRTWALEQFPGLTDLARVQVRTKTFSTEEEFKPSLVGRWHDVLLEFSIWPDGRHAVHPVAVCACCGSHVWSGGMTVFSIAEFAHRYQTSPATSVAECFACAWLHPAQDDARRRTSRLSQWWFQQTRRHTVDEVLAEHHRAA